MFYFYIPSHRVCVYVCVCVRILNSVMDLEGKTEKRKDQRCSGEILEGIFRL